jgi:hypothetical protein
VSRPGSLDVREGVEGAVGDDAGHARQLVEAVDDELAALRELGHHRVHLVARASSAATPASCTAGAVHETELMIRRVIGSTSGFGSAA